MSPQLAGLLSTAAAVAGLIGATVVPVFVVIALTPHECRIVAAVAVVTNIGGRAGLRACIRCEK